MYGLKLSDVRDIFTRKCRRMAFECILQSHGLSEKHHSHILQLRNEGIFKLEYLTLEQVMSSISKGQHEYSPLLQIPLFLYCSLVHRLISHGVCCPTVTLKLLQRPLTELNLSDNTNSSVIYSKPIFHRLRELPLEKLVLDNCSSLTDASLMHLKVIKSLKVLSLSGCQSLTNDSFRHIKELKNLKSLSVSRVGKVSTAGVAHLSDGDSSVLEILDLSYTSVEENSPHSNIFKTLQHHSRLHTLNISGATKLHHLYELRNLLSLRHLIASRNTLSKDAIEQEIGKLTRLEYINLEGTDIKGGYQCLQYIFDLPLLAYCNLSIKVFETTHQSISHHIESINLTTLSLANNLIVDDLMLAQLLKPLSRLLALDVSRTRVSSRCLKEELPRLANLKVLGLQGLELHDDDLVFLAKLSKIRKLNLNDTLLTDTFVTKNYLAGCSSLELLSLCRTHISDRGLGSIMLNNLRTLWLDGCSVSVEVVLSLSVSKCKNLSYVSLRESKPIRNEEEILAAEVLDMLD
ncbi:hypothetical protein EB796_010055 [Bugula neritina]|uniref:Uncharacterized protein n=1 Tax=Bugula neritina TaxID=10212 RepID=A0A7J7K0A2_BUGNE|nr:hypothetical protein EB796_010055 [Bugula neritina]